MPPNLYCFSSSYYLPFQICSHENNKEKNQDPTIISKYIDPKLKIQKKRSKTQDLKHNKIQNQDPKIEIQRSRYKTQCLKKLIQKQNKIQKNKILKPDPQIEIQKPISKNEIQEQDRSKIKHIQQSHPEIDIPKLKI